MEQVKFGDYLRYAREHSGMTLVQAAQRLRIQPEILQAIERSDVRSMPPRAYSRNMVAAYAKMLDLNHDEFCNLYLAELDRVNQGVGRDQYRMDRAAQAPSSTERMDRAYPSNRDSYADNAPYRTGRISADRTSRIPLDDADNYRITSYAGRRSSEGSRGLRNQDRVSRRRFDDRDRSDEVIEESDDREIRRSSRGDRAERGSSNPVADFAGSVVGAVSNFINSRRDGDVFAGASDEGGKKRIVIIAVAVVVVLLLAFALISRGCSSKDANETMPVTAVENQNAPAEKAPTSFKFEYSIDEGYEPWIEIYVDGEQEIAETMTGPTSGSYDVTGTIELCSANTDGIHIKIDGVEQKLEIDESQGILDATYDFKDILAKWEEAHGVTPSVKNDTSTKKKSNSTDKNSDSASSNADDNNSDNSSTPSGEQVVNEPTYDGSQDYYQEDQYYSDDYYSYDDGTATTGA